MSSTDQAEPASVETRTPAQDIPSRPQEDLPSSTPVEMSSLKDKSAVSAHRLAEGTSAPHPPSSVPVGPVRTDTTTALAQSAVLLSSPPPVTPAPIARIPSTAIGPSSDQPLPPSKDNETGPTLLITLLLTSGARHPFKLDPKYLSKRNVDVPGNDPFNLSVYKLKELILREWRDEWEAKPNSPSFIRLISFGKLLDDKAPLKDSRFNSDAPNVVHMTIKPQDYVEDEDAKGAKAGYTNSRDGGDARSPGCRCVIM